MTRSIPLPLLLTSLVPLLPACVVSGGVDDPTDDDDDATDDDDAVVELDACGLNPDTRSLLEEVLNDAALELGWVVGNFHSGEATYALGLVGQGTAWAGSATLFMPCEGEVQFDPYCEPDDEAGIAQRCLRLACTGPDAPAAEVLFAPADAEDPMNAPEFRYPAEGYDGEVVWDGVPRKVWHTAAFEGGTAVSTQVDANVELRLENGSVLDVSHRGTLTGGTWEGEGVTTFAIELDFPNLAAEGALEARISLTDGETGGTILQGGAPVATVEDPGETFVVDWTGC